MSGFSILAPTWTAGALATSSQDLNVQLNAQNLLSVQATRYWQTSTATGIELTLDAGEARPWNAIALLYSNGTLAGTLRANSNASTGSLFSAPSFNSGIQELILPSGPYVYPMQHGWYASQTTQTHRYIGLEIEDPTNPQGFFSAGVVVAGTLFTPKIGADLGSSHGYRDPSISIDLASNERIKRPKRSKKIGRFVFPKQDEVDTMQWDYLMMAFGNKIPMVFKWEPRVNATYQRQTTIYAFAEWGDITYVHAHGAWTVDFSLEEL